MTTFEGNASAIEPLLWRKARAIFPDDPESQARFVALAFQESGFNPKAHNTRGEDSYGLFQFGPDMRRAYGMNVGDDAGRQIDAGADYLRKLHAKHKGDWASILAEHNLGQPRMERWKKEGVEDAAVRRFRENHLPAVDRLTQRFLATAKPPDNQREMPGQVASAPPVAAPMPVATKATQATQLPVALARRPQPQMDPMTILKLISMFQGLGNQAPPVFGKRGA